MIAGELERIVKLDRLPSGAMTIEASANERSALAARFGLPAIHALTAEIALEPAGAAIDARGRMRAVFDQNCAIADTPFANTMDVPLAIRFVPALALGSEDEAIEFAGDQPDEIEYEGAALDLGEAVAQSFGLALDPYATGPEADIARAEAGIVDEGAPSGPFAILKNLVER